MTPAAPVSVDAKLPATAPSKPSKVNKDADISVTAHVNDVVADSSQINSLQLGNHVPAESSVTNANAIHQDPQSKSALRLDIDAVDGSLVSSTCAAQPQCTSAMIEQNKSTTATTSNSCMQAAASSICNHSSGPIDCQYCSTSTNTECSDLASKPADQVTGCLTSLSTNTNHTSQQVIASHGQVQEGQGEIVANGEHVLAEPKIASVQRCTSWSPSVDSKVHGNSEEHRRKTTDSIPANLGEQFNDESSKASTALSAELAHIFGRKQSVPCGNAGCANNDCEHCGAAISATMVTSLPDTNTATCESPAPMHTSSPATVVGAPTLTTTEVMTPTLSDISMLTHLSNVIQPQPVHTQQCSTCSQAKLKQATHKHDDEDTASSITKIARLMKHVSYGGPGRPPADSNGQVVASSRKHFIDLL